MLKVAGTGSDGTSGDETHQGLQMFTMGHWCLIVMGIGISILGAWTLRYVPLLELMSLIIAPTSVSPFCRDFPLHRNCESEC